MKKLKKFKRFDGGGSTGEFDPLANNIDYDKQKAQGEKNLERLKDLFGFSKKEAAPIEEGKPSFERAKPSERESVKPTEPAKSEKVEPPRVSKSETTVPSDRGETNFGYEAQRKQNPELDEAKEQGRRAAAAFKPAAKSAASKPAATSRNDEKGNSRGSGSYPINVSTGASGFGKSSTSSTTPKSAKSPGPEDIPGTDVTPGPKGERIDNSNLAAKQFGQSVLGASPALRGVGAGIRGAMSLGRMLESAPKAEGAGTGKLPEAKPTEVSSRPAVDRVKEANIKGPPSSAAMPKSKTPAEKMGLRETSAMERSRKANEEGPPDTGARARRVDRAQKRSDLIPAKDREPGMLQEYISGRDAARTRARDLPDDGLSTPRYANKKGGKIPAFKNGGLVSRADGCAIRGRTKGRMV